MSQEGGRGLLPPEAPLVPPVLHAAAASVARSGPKQSSITATSFVWVAPMLFS